MYPWVKTMHTHLGGECPHKCVYCYVQRNRFGVAPRYKGDLRMYAFEVKENYYRFGKNSIVFIEHMNDLFCDEVPHGWIQEVIDHVNRYPDNEYVFQTKNPERILNYINYLRIDEKKLLIGTTIETNRDMKEFSGAPDPRDRYSAIQTLNIWGYRTFITIEPIFKFDLKILLEWIVNAQPDFVNIGADSKGCNLPEPSKKDILGLIENLQRYKIPIRKKANLKRLLK